MLQKRHQRHWWAALGVTLSSLCFELQVLMRQRSAYQMYARVIHPIAAVAMRGPSQVASLGEMPQVNEKPEALLKRSYHWWRLYRSFTRTLGLLSRVYSWSTVES